MEKTLQYMKGNTIKMHGGHGGLATVLPDIAALHHSDGRDFSAPGEESTTIRK